MPRIVVIAGEASGDRLGASFIRSARQRLPELEFEGVAGPEMRAAGCEAWFDSQELAVMGVVDVVRHLPRILHIMRAVVRRLREDPPDAFVGIDAPDFNLRVEQKARRLGIPVVHYVCPSVWAWREGRVRVLRRACDLILCLLPFEPAFLARHRVNGEFIGHPLADEIQPDQDHGAVRERLGLGPGTLVALLPGSRHGEVQRIGPDFARTADWLREQIPDCRFVVPAASAALRDLIQAQFDAHAPSVPVTLLDGQSHAAIAAADAVLLTSGTAALEVMLSSRPMVVAYRMGQVNYALARLLHWSGIMKGEFFSLPNLLAGRAVVPELLQSQVRPEIMGEALLKLLAASPERAAQLQSFGKLQVSLRQFAGNRAAAAVLRQAGLLRE